MDKSFDDLFNEFFKKNNINPEDKLSSRDKERAKFLIDILAKLNNASATDSDMSDELEKEMDESLGKPDKVEFFNEGSLFYERRIWYTEEGEIQKLVFSEDPTLIMPTPNIIETLQKKLNSAVESEDFEQAASIRDEITKLEKPKVEKPKRKRTKKEK